MSDADAIHRLLGSKVDPKTNQQYSQAELDNPPPSADEAEADEPAAEEDDEEKEDADPLAPFRPVVQVRTR